LISPRQLELFNNFAKYWQEITGSELLLLSARGELLTPSNGVAFKGWPEISKQLSDRQPTFLVYSQQNILAAPLSYDEQLFGYLLARNARADDTRLLAWGAESMVTQWVDAQALQSMTDELIGAWEQLELIYKVTASLAVTSDLRGTLKSILAETQKVVNTKDGFVLMQNPESLLRVTCLSAGNETAYDETLLNNLVQMNRVVVCNSAVACRSVWPQAPASVKSLLATRLIMVDEDIKAAIGLINKADKSFTSSDAKLLAALAQQVAAIIRNFLAHQRMIVKERLSRELEIAAEIQSTLLPAQLPQMGGVSMAVSSAPAAEVGSDFYDFITVDDRHLTLVIGDIAGKGIPAALLISVTRTLLRVEAMRGEPPHKIIQQANNILYQDLDRVGSSIRIFVATVDTFEGKLTYANAGHTPTLLYRAETRAVEQLEANSTAIGLSAQQRVDSRIVDLHSGDTLVFYTDGVINAQSANNDLFGLGRLIYIVEARGNDSPEALQQHIQAEVVNFNKHAATRDDETLLIVKMLPYSDMVAPQHISTLIKTVDFLYPADTNYLSEISRQISATCRELPSLPTGSRGDDFIYLIELAISEICTNIIKHAYGGQKGEIRGQITLLNNGVELDFYDQGIRFDPNMVPEPQADPHQLNEGGYGLHIVRQIMDVVAYENKPGQGNHWRLIKFLPRL
jgi:serine phosphatase RsbU (regulator of sigma subunit)/anti-sigma regulatory factor (Ser/Thr protein kinase)/rRNA-processing protein FCF1